jgi:hypothetical protein
MGSLSAGSDKRRVFVAIIVILARTMVGVGTIAGIVEQLQTSSNGSPPPTGEVRRGGPPESSLPF